MTVSQIHAAVVAAYREALAGTDFEGIKITPIDRETEDVIRGAAETEYDADYSRECDMRVITVTEALYYYANNPKQWKIETNNFQELIEDRLLEGLPGDMEITAVECETAGGAVRISFTVTLYEVVNYNDRDQADNDNMQTLNQTNTMEV